MGKLRRLSGRQICRILEQSTTTVPVPDHWREHILGRYLRAEVSRDQTIERVGIDWVVLAERQFKAMTEDVAWALGD